MKLLSLLALLALLWLVPLRTAHAIDPGTVTGNLVINGKPIPLKYSYTLLHDNAEKLLRYPQELRLLLTDRPVPADALHGTFLLPVESSAVEGEVQGILLTMNPTSPQKTARLTLLLKPSEAGRGLNSKSVEGVGGKAFKEWAMTAQRVTGTLVYHEDGFPDLPDVPKVDATLRFSAPLMKVTAITADLKGKDAVNSPQMQVLAAASRAQKNGDVDALAKLSTARLTRRSKVAIALQGSEVTDTLKKAGAETEKMIPTVLRVIVRGERAVALFPGGGAAEFAREGGEWKMDD